MDTAKKEENRKPRKKKEREARTSRYCLSGVIASAHSFGHPKRLENRKGRSGHWPQQKKKKIENQEKKEQKFKSKGKCLSGVIASAH